MSESEKTVAKILLAQCKMHKRSLDQVRALLVRGSAGQKKHRSPQDLSESKENVLGRLSRFSDAVLLFSNIGHDANLDDESFSHVVREFWRTWAPDHAVEIESDLQADPNSFKDLLPIAEK